MIAAVHWDSDVDRQENVIECMSVVDMYDLLAITSQAARNLPVNGEISKGESQKICQPWKTKKCGLNDRIVFGLRVLSRASRISFVVEKRNQTPCGRYKV